MGHRMVVAVLMALSLVGEAGAQEGLSRTLFAELTLGGGSIIKQGGCSRDLQGAFRGPTWFIRSEGITLESVGYGSRMDGHLSLRGAFGAHVWRHVWLFVAGELSWPLYTLEEGIRTTHADGRSDVDYGPVGDTRDLHVKWVRYLFAPTLGARLYATRAAAGPYVEVQWGRMFRHVDLYWNPERYEVRWYHFARVRDREAKGLMRLGVGNQYPLSERTSAVVHLGVTSVRNEGLFFLGLGDGGQYITFDGMLGVTYRF